MGFRIQIKVQGLGPNNENPDRVQVPDNHICTSPRAELYLLLPNFGLTWFLHSRNLKSKVFVPTIIGHVDP